ncbi:MAG: metallophosphoesterase family protein [Bdellovibrionota bacterium]
MKLVFGGIYGNLQALEALREQARALGIPAQEVYCTGDSVAYCAEPNESLRLLREWGPQIIAGNVELQLAAEAEDCACGFAEGSSCERLSRDWYPRLSRELDPEHRQWMRGLPRVLRPDPRTAMVHGSFTAVSKFIYEDTAWAVKEEEFTAAHAEVILAGHSGIPFIQNRSGKTWVNAGAIGMPANDGTPHTWYALSGDAGYELHRLHYDHELAARRMRERGWSEDYARCLLTGLWPGDAPQRPPALQARSPEVPL